MARNTSGPLASRLAKGVEPPMPPEIVTAEGDALVGVKVNACAPLMPPDSVKPPSLVIKVSAAKVIAPEVLEQVVNSSRQSAEMARAIERTTAEQARGVTQITESSVSIANQIERIAREIDDRVAQFYLLAALGCHAAGAGQTRLAARLIASAG